MKPEPLIQKLFAIERAIGRVSSATLRAMVIDAQESALRMDLDNLHDIDTLRRHLEERRIATRSGGSPEEPSLPRSA